MGSAGLTGCRASHLPRFMGTALVALMGKARGRRDNRQTRRRYHARGRRAAAFTVSGDIADGQRSQLIDAIAADTAVFV